MRIALVILHADRSRGGAETYTLDLAQALARRGHDVSLLASSFAGDLVGITCVNIPALGLTRTTRYKAFLSALDAHTKATQYDVVHAMLPVHRCDVYHPHAGIAAEGAMGLTGFFNPRRRAMARVERHLLTGPTGPAILCLSDYVKSFVRKHYPLPEDRLVRLFNAVDLERFEPGRVERARTGETVHLLMIAQDFKRKGLQQVIDAMALRNDGRLRLTVVGRDDLSPFKAAIARHGLVNSVRFTGPTPDPRPFYTASDVFVLPTRHDPCSLVVLEALAMGVPVISTRFNGATEIMTDGVHGYVLDDPQDVGALSDRLKKMQDPSLRESMRQACLALRPTLSYETHLDTLEGVYRKVKERPAQV